MKTYLITGGCGFIGVNLISRLTSRATEIRVLDNLSMGVHDDIKPFAVDFHEGDIRDQSKLAEVCRGVDVVVHLAAHTRVIDSISQPQLNFEINALGTLNVLEACRLTQVKKVVFASTGGAILGEQEPPVHEGMVPKPVSPYGASKLAGEGYCSAYSGSYGLNTVALRFSNVYGPHSYRKGSVIAQYFKNLIHGEPLVIYGDGYQTRDFVYVDDLVDAIVLADSIDAPGQVFQIASGRETSVLDLLVAIRRVVPNLDFEVRHQPTRTGEIIRNYASITKARRLLGFDPKTSLSAGLAQTWAWFDSNRSRIV